MEPSERKKRMLIGVAGALVALIMMGGFFWPILKTFHQARQNGRAGSNLPLLVFGGFFLVMVLAVVFSVARGIRKLSKPSAELPRDPQPWLARPDWAAGKIKSSATVPTKFFLLWSVMAMALSAPAVWHLPQEWQKGNRLILLVLIFPVVAVTLLGYSFATWRSRRRYGDCSFEMAAIPGALGGTLEGLIQTGARLNLEHGLHLKLSCVRVTVSGSGENQSRQETILWQDEKVFDSKAGLPETEPGRTGIPVFFKLPSAQPESGNGVFWRLDAKARLSGPDFSATFDLPVFRVAGVNTAAEEPDPTAALQMPVEELRREENSKIQVADGPRGKEFYFPAARNAVPAILFMLFGIGATVGCGALIVHHVSYFAAAIVGLFAVIFDLAGFNMLFKSSRVTVDSLGVTLRNRWLVFSRTRRFEASEVARFDTAVGMTSGTTAFHDIKLITHEFERNNFEANKRRYQQTGELPQLKNLRIRDGRGITLGSAVASAAEAKWLVQEMTRALGRSG